MIYLKFYIFAYVAIFGAFAEEPGQVPDQFRNHPGSIASADAIFYCIYNTSECNYNYDPSGGEPLTATVNGVSEEINGEGSIDQDSPLTAVHLRTGRLSGTKCLYFSIYTNEHDINWAFSIKYAHKQTFTALVGGINHVKKITVGVGSPKDYYISFHLYGRQEHTTPTFGEAQVGLFALVDGPCPEDNRTLNCTFDFGLCEWDFHGQKYIWYQVPFGLHHTIPHAIEWGALAAFAGKGHLWSPVVRSVKVRCFSFIFAKGESTEVYLRVWILYRIPGFKDFRVLMYENISERKILKRLIQINIFVPYDFQIAFEGRSKTILHGVVILHTAISDHFCDGVGSYSNVKDETPEIPSFNGTTFTAPNKVSTAPPTLGV